jgi:hypothetical protein
MHYCDVGLSSLDPTDGGFGASIIRNIGGSNHRYLRGYHTISATFFQPNVPGIAIVENYIDEFLYPYGDGGTQGIIPNPDAGHLNGISSEGGMTSIQILRNHIIAESPDGATGSTGSALGHIGYGTQVGQSGYGAGTNPGRLIASTDCIALFTSNGQPNIGDGITDLQIKDNYLGGTGYALYAGNTTAQGVICTGNTFTTKYWPNSGQFGPVTYEPAWGSNGNVATGNLWADDYGTSPHPGSDLLATRQYPTGNGPRTGAVIFGTDVTTLTNNFSGGTNGTTITAGNSGGASGNAFDSVIAQFGGAVTYDNTQTHLSSLSALLGVAGNSNASVNWTTALGTQTKIYFRDYLYLGGYSTGFSLYVISPLPSSGFSGNVIIDGAGTIKYLDNNGTAQITMTTTAPLNAWFRLEGFQDTTLGQVSLSLYLTPDSSTPDETHTTATGGSFGLSMVGLEFSANQSGAGPTFSVWVTGVGVSNVGPLGPIVPPATGSIPGHFYPFTGTRANHPFKPFH